MKQKILLVNGDDFGLNRQMNHGILDSARRGILTQATLLLGQPGTSQAITMAQRHNLPLGLHLNLTVGKPSAPLNKIPSLINGETFRNPGFCAGKPWDAFVQTLNPSEVAIELASQVAEFGRLVGKPPTHIDSHEVLSGHPRLLPVFLELAKTTKLPLRRPVWYRYATEFAGKNTFFYPLPKKHIQEKIDTTDHIVFLCDVRLGGVEKFIQTLRELRPGRTALVTHPAHKNLPVKQEIALRHLDHELLTHPSVHETIKREQITLSTFAQEYARWG